MIIINFACMENNYNYKRKYETLIYVALWLLAIMLFLLDGVRSRSYTGLPLIDTDMLRRMCMMFIPLSVLFLVNNCLLIPKLLKRGHYGLYFVMTALTVGGIWLWQRYAFFALIAKQGLPVLPAPNHPGPTPLLPLPLFLDAIYDVLVVGINLAVSLLFQHFQDRFVQERLKKENAENQLVYLKAQINPHFYMNMLNNIHGMIEINPLKAQDMVIEMSGLMRYMLYESSRSEIELVAEVTFIDNYIALMRERYPENIVSISVKLPDTATVRGIQVPPLLFLVFIENAFKHGLSYANHSFVAVSIELHGNNIEFSCINSVHASDKRGQSHGVGLENVKRRLDLIYGKRHILDVTCSETAYSVNLTLPLHETENSDN